MKNNPFSKIKKELAKVDDILQKNLENYSVERKEISQKLEEKNIKIMFYGIYNAGKSTLINTILSEDKAKIGDIPTTDTIDTYTWNDYLLLDTPGINAPIKHEKITKKQLNKSDLIVFVIRKDDEDNASIYKELFKLLKKEKDIFLVFNYENLKKDTLGEGSVALSIERLNKIMLKESSKHNIDISLIKKINLIPINLKTALKGKLADKSKLIEHSNYNQFEDKFNLWLQEYNTEHQILKTLKAQIEKQLFRPIIESFKLENSNLDILLEQLTLVESQKSILLSDIKNYIQMKIVETLNTIISLLKTNQEYKVNTEIETLYQDIEHYLSSELKEKISIIDKKNIEILEITEEDEGASSNLDIAMIIPIIESIPLPPPMKIVAQMITSLISMFSMNDEATDRHNENERLKALQISQATKDIRETIMTSMNAQTIEIIEKSFENTINELNEKIDEINQDISRDKNTKNILERSLIKIHKINF